ncbi:hypothetical protein KBC03_05685 [Patescibacteria group bacterium]|nr:hypothetical protein [Patescibacteria group bacterium]
MVVRDLLLLLAMQTRHSFTKKRSLHIGRWVVLALIIAIVRMLVAWARPISLRASVMVKKGDTINAFLAHLTGREKLKVKSYIKTHSVDL